MAYPNLQLSTIVTAYTVIILCGSSSCLKIVGVAVPTLADLRQPASLGCSYDLGHDKLFSVKWYKDDHEFYRYMPTHKPSILTFPLTGARLESALGPGDKSCGRSHCSITLNHLSPAASGAYTCEVSTEAPTFRTAIETRNMTVMAFLDELALPLEEPRIEGLRSAYTIGEVLDITCRSAPSAPPAHLTLFVNNEEVGQKQVTRAEEPVEDELASSSARLKMVLSRGHFKGGGGSSLLRVRCSAALAAVEEAARSADATAALAASQPLHNQKLEWPSAAGKCLSSPNALVMTSVFAILRKIF